MRRSIPILHDRFPLVLPVFLLSVLLVPVLLVPPRAQAADLWNVYEGSGGPGEGKEIVLVSGDEEYRSEEALTQLGRILAKHHGFKCTVVYAIDPKTGVIDNNTTVARAREGSPALIPSPIEGSGFFIDGFGVWACTPPSCTGVLHSGRGPCGLSAA